MPTSGWMRRRQHSRVQLDDHRDRMAANDGPNDRGCVTERILGVSDRHGRIGHDFQIRSATDLLVRDRGGADRRGHGDLALAEIGVGGLQLRDYLVAAQTGDVDRADAHAGDDPGRVVSGKAQGHGREDKQKRQRAHYERGDEPGRPESPRRLRSRSPERVAEVESTPGRSGRGGVRGRVRCGRLDGGRGRVGSLLRGGGIGRQRFAGGGRRIWTQDLIDQVYFVRCHVRSFYHVDRRTAAREMVLWARGPDGGSGCR